MHGLRAAAVAIKTQPPQPLFEAIVTMKTHSSIRQFCLAGSIAALLAIHSAHAANLAWDASCAGFWLDAGLWWDCVVNATRTSCDDAILGNGGTGGAVALSGPRSQRPVATAQGHR